MNKKIDTCVQISADWIGDGQTISHGSLRRVDILRGIKSFLSWSLDHLNEVEGSYSPTRQEIEDTIDECNTLLKYRTLLNDWYDGHPPALEDVNENIAIYVNEQLFDFVNELLPDDYYFGTHPGDGSLFGVWKNSIREVD